MSMVFAGDLFVAQDGTPMCFNISRCENIEELQDYIEYGGGLVQENIGPFTIIIEDGPPVSSSATLESFQSDFIIKCCSQNKILPLAQFRRNSVTWLSADFNPNDILHHKISWENAKQQNNEVSGDSESEQSISIDERKHALTHSNGPRKTMRSTREEFTQLERKKIVQFIVETKSYSEVTGSALWKRMHQKLKIHTWQSLKEHFIKKIMPLIHIYDLSSDEVNYLRTGMKVKNPKKKSSFTRSEDDIILNYVSRFANPNTPVGGNEFWKKMQKKPHVPGRTWQAVRERYLKVLKKMTPTATPQSGSSIPQTPPQTSDCTQKDQGVENLSSVDIFASTDEIPPPISASTQNAEGSENMASVNSVSCTSAQNQHCTPSKSTKKADRQPQEQCYIEPGSSSQETNSQWPSNFPREQVVFISECEEESTSEISEKHANEDNESMQEDSEWSDDGLRWRGGVVIPDEFRGIKRDQVGLLQKINKHNICHHETDGEQMEMMSEEQCITGNRNKPEVRVQDCLITKKRGHPLVGSCHFKSQSLTGRDATFDFLPTLQNSYDESRYSQNSLITCNGSVQNNSQSNFSVPVSAKSPGNSQQISKTRFANICTEKPHKSDVSEKILTSEGVHARVMLMPRNKKHVGVQTDPVLVLPKGWSFPVQEQRPSSPSLPLNALQVTVFPDVCPSPAVLPKEWSFPVQERPRSPSLPLNALQVTAFPDVCPSPVPGNA